LVGRLSVSNAYFNRSGTCTDSDLPMRDTRPATHTLLVRSLILQHPTLSLCRTQFSRRFDMVSFADSCCAVRNTHVMCLVVSCSSSDATHTASSTSGSSMSGASVLLRRLAHNDSVSRSWPPSGRDQRTATSMMIYGGHKVDRACEGERARAWFGRRQTQSPARLSL